MHWDTADLTATQPTGFDPYNLSQYTNAGALSSLSNYISSQFGSLDSLSLGAAESSYLASQRSQAYSYLSLASSLVADGGASNSAAASVLASLSSTAGGALASASKAGASAAATNSAASASSGPSGSKSGSSNAAVAACSPSYAIGMIAFTFVAAMAGAFAL